jgi:phospholipase/carboxylesterase
MLEALEINPKRAPKSAVIWLHGLGADGGDFAPLVWDWGLADELGTRFVLPHAPPRPVTLNRGMVMRAWYDIYDLDFDAREEDVEGIETARRHLWDLIHREQQRGIDTDRIVLAGFSQGGAVVLHTAIRSASPFAGVLVLSGYLPLADTLAEKKHAEASRMKLRMDHGDRDSVVPLIAAERSREALEAQGYNVEFHTYHMDHGLCIAQLESLRDWLASRIDEAVQSTA